MLVQCSYCGAPLDVSGGKPTVKCRYCEKTSQLQSLRTVSPQTPRGWKPPPVWTPPPNMPSGAAPLRYHGAVPLAAVVAGMAAAMVLLMTVGVFVFVGMARPRGGPGVSQAGGLPVAQLAAVTMRESPEQLARITRVNADQSRNMRVPLSGSRFNAVTFEWDADQPTHVKRFFLNLSGADPRDAEIRKRLGEILGRRFQGESFQWEGCGIYFAPSGGVLSVSVDRSRSINGENPIWQQQVETLWAVVKAAALGLPGAPDPQVVRDYLGTGYPLRAAASLDPDTTVEASDAAVKALFRGAVRQLHIDLSYTVALDHPWFGQAELSWANKKASQLKEIELRPPPGQQKFANQPDLVACMTALLGKPTRVSEGDYLRGDGKDFTFRPKGGGEVRIYEHMVAIWTRDNPFAGSMPKDRLQKVVQAFDACGRPAR